MSETPQKPKSTKATVAQRIEEVLRIRLDGAEFWDVREYAREKEAEPGTAWELPPDGKPLSDSQLWRYISQADRMIAESCRASRKKLLRRHLAQRRNLYAKAVSQGDTRAALAVLSDEAKLLGLYAPTKIAPVNPKGDRPYGELTDAERRAALAALYAAMGAGDRDAVADGQDDPNRSLLGRSDEDSDRRRHDAGRLASQADEGDMEEGVTPLLEAGGEIFGCGGADVG